VTLEIFVTCDACNSNEIKMHLNLRLHKFEVKQRNAKEK